jgi:diguanylate cyclase (GGDEF)-like protein/PAS domain S-box-containing protein
MPADAHPTFINKDIPNPAIRVVMAVVLPLVSLGIQWSLWSWLQPFSWLLFYPSVFVAAHIDGRRGALISASIAALLVVYFFTPPYLSWSGGYGNNWMSVAIFLTMGWLLGEVREKLNAGQERERRSYSQRNAELAAIVNSTNDAVMSGTLDGKIISWNRGAERLYGYSEQEVVGQPIAQHYAPKQQEEVARILARASQGETIVGLESRRISKSGQEFFISATVAPIRDASGAVVAASMIARDITQSKLDQAARQHSERRFESLFNSMDEGFFLADLVFNEAGDAVNWRYLDINPAFTKIIGKSRSEVIGKTVLELFPAMDAQWFASCTQVARSGQSLTFERFGPATGRYYACNYYSPQRNQLACIFSDITERKLTQMELQASQARYARIMDGADQGFWEWDLACSKITVSARFESILGYAEGKFSMEPSQWATHIHADDYPRTHCAVVQNLRGVSSFLEAEMRCRNQAGSWCWVRIRGKVTARDGANRALMLSGTLTDISQHKQAEELIWQQANYDPLTRLPNRSMLRDRLEQEIKKSLRDDSRIAILFIDLDHFKEVNDTLGHGRGDQLLLEAARRIQTCIRESDTISRQGGDEFTVVLPQASNLERIEGIAQNILTVLSQGVDLEGEQTFVSASIGIALFPDDATNMESLSQCADQALYAAKDAGRNRFSFFTPDLQDSAQTRMRLTNDLRNALMGHQLRLVYQPIVQLATGKVHKAEALIRWQHPLRGLISPADFIPLAESSGLIIDIGEWVFRKAALQARQWRQSHHPQFQISVNKSPVQFSNGYRQHGAWSDYLQSLGLPGQAIVVEITEGLLLAPRADIITQLSDLRQGGLGVSLDDFGTGYSSLSYLQKFDIDFVKIDQSFVRNLTSASKNMALCKAIIVMAHELGMEVIAEGIETEDQRHLLTAAGCDYGQGYLFSRPIPPVEFDSWMKTNPHATRQTAEPETVG